jgi:hypothetical protein
VRVEDTDDLRRVERYVRMCRELARSTLLSHDGGMTLSKEDGQEPTASLDLPTMEAICGTVVVFR